MALAAIHSAAIHDGDAGRDLHAAAAAADVAAQSTSSTTIEIVFLLLIAATVLAVIARRLAIPYPVPARNVFIVAWAGMRGVVSLAAALALPSDFPERDLLIFLTFAVILATLVGQGLTLPLLIHRLDIDDGAGLEGQEEAYARYIAADAATARLESLAAEWPGHLELIDTLRAHRGRSFAWTVRARARPR